MKKQVLNLILLIVVAAPVAFAQSTVKFNGLGRAAIQNDGLSDTTSLNEGKRTGGHTLLDLGVTVTRDDILRVNTILRVRNEFGGFFGEGASFEFRQMRIEGLIGNYVKYEIGDLDVGLTPYTIHNEDQIWHDFESELFGIKRDVINYENFYTDENTWRMQGLNVYTTLKFDKGIDNLKLRTFGNRIKSTDFISIPSRFVYGFNAVASKSKYGTIGVNYVTTEDIEGTVKSSSMDYNNSVMTIDYDLGVDVNDKIKAGIKGEFGSSKLSMYRAIDDTTAKTDGAFYDFGAYAEYKPLNLEVGGSFHAVDKGFNSPTAQTLRLGNAGALSPVVFPNSNNGQARAIGLFDTYSQDQGLYNQSISTVLMMAPVLSLSTPYGKASPNRSGISLYAKMDSSKFYEVSVEADLLSEISAENDSISQNKRSFTSVEAGGKLFVNKLIGFEKEISVGAGYKMESVKRDGLKVDLNSKVIDLALDIEVVSDLHVMLGYKGLTVNGNEFLLARDEFNKVPPTSTPLEYVYDDYKTNILAFGLKYNFSQYAFFSVQAQAIEYALAGTKLEDQSQVYFNYTVKF